MSTWEQYNRTSGPLTKHVKAGDRDVEIDVRIFYGKPGSDTDPDTDAGGKVLENDARESLAHSDVIIYTGHSGPF